MQLQRVCLKLAALVSAGVWFASSRPVLAVEPDASHESDEIAAFPAIEQFVALHVFPASVALATADQTMQPVVTAIDAGGREIDATAFASVSISDDSVVQSAGGRLHPIGDGNATVRYTVPGASVEQTVEVANGTESRPASFYYGVLPALTKQGCNSGACHGSPSGKGGFRLSLRAYDPGFDEATLIREEFGRRIDPVNPTASLLLRKPTMQVAHGGGKRLHADSYQADLLQRWIAEGRRIDDDAPQVESLTVFPAGRALHGPHWRQQLVVLARFSDGEVRDVTRLTSFSSSDQDVAAVDENGLVLGAARGEVAVLARYEQRMATAELMFLEDVPTFAWPEVAARNYVDEHVFAKLQTLQIPLASLCTDEEFCRRVHLDVVGRLPTVAETEAFLADSSPDARDRLIDDLLDRPEFADYWAQKWADLLRLNDKQMSRPAGAKLHAWLRQALSENLPYDRFAAALLTAEGSTLEHPAANFYRREADFSELAETTAQVFLGVRVQCAKCHNHPFERWTQDDYYGIGAFFNRVRQKPGAREGEFVVWNAREGEVTQPRTGRQVGPQLPGVELEKVAADRRATFAEWLIAPENPYFAAAEANRLWAEVMGRGIVDPVDDFRDSNPPSNRPLLEALAADFSASGYDRRALLRTILRSRTYQSSYRTNDLNADDDRWFSHAAVRLLPAEPLLDAVCHVTGVPEDFAGHPVGFHATQLIWPDGGNDFLKAFGAPARETACACERGSDANLTQALQMINGGALNAKLRDDRARFRVRAAEGWGDAEIVEELFLLAFCRRPTSDELAAARAHIAAADDRLRALEDVCWGILNSKEFLFQH